MHHISYEPIMQRLLRWKQIQASQRLQRKRRPHRGSGRLISLPLELVQLVLDRLDIVSLVCLRNTTRRFRNLISSVEEQNLSRCQKWLIMCRFKTDMQKYPEMVACAFCKVKRPQKHFGIVSKNDGFFQKIEYSDIKYLNMMSSKPVERYCYRHLASCLGWPPSYQNAKQIKWIHTLEPTCLHCGSKPASCGQSSVKFHNQLATHVNCIRPCDVCPTAYLSTYSRHGQIRAHRYTPEGGDFVCCFGRTKEGALAMAEWQGKKRILFLFGITDKPILAHPSGYYIMEKSSPPLSNKDFDNYIAQDGGWSLVHETAKTKRDPGWVGDIDRVRKMTDLLMIIDEHLEWIIPGKLSMT